MKKRTLKRAAALTLAVAVMAPAASALSWKDGAPANYNFTYGGDNGGIASVKASDTNGTYNGEIKAGETITTQTGTIVWRDSYTNVTTFTVTTEPGYELVGLSGTNVVEDDFRYDGGNTYTFSFTDKGAEAWCYGKDVSFDLVTDKTMYTITFANEDGNELGFITAALDESLFTSIVPEKEGYTFSRWMLDETTAMPDTFTADMLKYADENKNITVTPEFTVNEYPVTINYYVNNNNGVNGGTLESKTDNVMVPYGTTINEAWLAENNRLSGYKMIGGDHDVTVGVDGAAIDLVKKEAVFEEDHAYFTYESKDDGVLSVTYGIEDKREGVNVDVNETIRMSYSDYLWGEKTITFTVQVADGKTLVLNCSDGSNEFTDNGDGTYTFAFTRGGTMINKPTDHITFALSTVEK